MGYALRQSTFTLDDFLAWEDTQPERHEYLHGETFAMVGARRVHNLVAGNLYVALRQHLRGTPCAAFMETMKLRVADDALFYPDVFVTCDRQDLRTEREFSAPTLIAEVLSPSTEGYDRGQKFTQYRRLASLREYLLISPETREVLLFRRESAQGLFTLHDFSEAQTLECASIGHSMPVAELFEGLDLPLEVAPNTATAPETTPESTPENTAEPAPAAAAAVTAAADASVRGAARPGA
jgi:Uma2 family endonuclease